MVDQLVVLIDLEYERVVDVVLAEDLDCHSSRADDEAEQ